MSGTRSNRLTKPPKKFEENEDGQSKQRRKVYILRLLEAKDITKRLLGGELYLLWPDDGLWYPAEIQKVDTGCKRADVIYTTTDEEENIDLAELIKDRSIAFREARPAGYTLKANEILDKEERPEASQSIEEEEEEQSAISSAEGLSDAQEEAQSSGVESEEEDVVGRKRRGARVEGEDEHDEEDRPLAKSRITRDGGSAVRPRRQITLSNKAQELLAAERAAQLEAILQRRATGEEDAPGTEDVPEPPEPSTALPQADTHFSTAEAYEQKLLSQISGNKNPLSPHRSGGSMRLHSSGSMSLEKEVREKAVEQITAALEKVLHEGSDDPSSLPDPRFVATHVELELYKLFGNAGKDYKAKYRSLIFNLRDAANPELRRRVLLGEIVPEKLVRYNANELASKQLSQWREEKEKEAMKAAVLDTQAAAKFSTAAALASKQSGAGSVVDWRDNTLATNSPVRDQQQQREASPGPANDAADYGVDEAVPDDPVEQQKPTSGPVKDSPGPDAKKTEATKSRGGENGEALTLPSASSLDSKSTAIRQGPSFNWSSIRANALQEWEDNPAQQSTASDNDPGEEDYNPTGLETAELQSSPAGHFTIAESTGPCEQIWHGVLGNACPVPLPAVIEYLAGNSAMVSGMPPRQIDVKGRVQLEKVWEFMNGLRTSRSRILSLALLRLTDDASEEEKGQMEELERQYKEKDRSGVLRHGEMEFYLMAQSPLAEGLLRACNGGVQSLKELPQHHLLVAAVHQKGLKAVAKKPPKGAKVEPKEHLHPTSKPLPEATEADKKALVRGATPKPEAPQSINSPATAVQEATQKPTKTSKELANELMVPQGLDLSSLGSLAAVLGVSQGLNLSVPSLQGTPAGAPSNQPQAGGSFRPGLQQAPQSYTTQAPNDFPTTAIPPVHQQQQQQLPGPPQNQWGSQPMQFHPYQQQQQPAQQQQHLGGYRGNHQQYAPASDQRGAHGTTHNAGGYQPQQYAAHQGQPHGSHPGMPQGHPAPQQHPVQLPHPGQSQGHTRPITLPRPQGGPRPITLQPPGPQTWRPRR